MSGTYRPVRGSVGQSGLPIRKLWLWTSQAEIDEMSPIKVMKTGMKGHNGWLLTWFPCVPLLCHVLEPPHSLSRLCQRAYYMDQGLLVQAKENDFGSAPAWHLHSSVAEEAKWNDGEEHVQPEIDMEHAEQFSFTPPPESGSGNGATALLERLVKEMNERSADENRTDNANRQKNLFRKELGFAKTWKIDSSQGLEI